MNIVQGYSPYLSYYDIKEGDKIQIDRALIAPQNMTPFERIAFEPGTIFTVSFVTSCKLHDISIRSCTLSQRGKPCPFDGHAVMVSYNHSGSPESNTLICPCVIRNAVSHKPYTF